MSEWMPENPYTKSARGAFSNLDIAIDQEPAYDRGCHDTAKAMIKEIERRFGGCWALVEDDKWQQFKNEVSSL